MEGRQMKKLIFLILLFLVTDSIWAGESVSVPWKEFKTLYTESITRQMMEETKKEKAPMIYSIESALYIITIDQQTVKGDVVLAGKVISGTPDLIPLFGNEVVIKDLNIVSGGSLLCDQKHHYKIFFLPDGNKNFEISFSFFTPIQEDNSSRFVSIAVPQALKNSLILTLAPEFSLVAAPGIKNSDETYHFSARSNLTIRFWDRAAVSAALVVKMDTLALIKLHGRQAVITTTFIPLQPVTTSFILEISENTTYLSSTLKSTWITALDEHRYQINIPTGSIDSFSIQTAQDESQTGGNYKFFLPRIIGNTGNQGNFIVEQPDDGQISLSENKRVSRLPVSRLNSKLLAVAGRDRFFMKIFPQEEISFSVKRFQTVSTPPIVLDSIAFFTSYEDNGSVLSVLIMDIPPEAGPRLSMKAIPNAEIWSLKVNGQKINSFEDQGEPSKNSPNKRWIIPLAGGETSHVELAIIRQIEKLGLHGKLEAELPAAGLPSTSVRIAIALPERLQLLSLEGPVSPAPENKWEKPDEFIGKPYFFSRAFYTGEGIKMTLFYKEPVN
jgi:hypothetical protein